MQSVEIGNGIHWLGANDRRKHLFENLWPLPAGVSYNSYLICDGKSALMDTVEIGSDADYLRRIESLLDGGKLDYLVVNHMEPDHSGEIGTIIRRYPDITVIGNSKTFKVLSAYYGALPCNIREVNEGDTLELGRHTLKFVMAPMVHWPETMMTYEISEQILFSADAFGTFGTIDGGLFDDQTLFSFFEDEMRRYYSNIVGKYGTMVQKALAKLADVPVRMICSLHGPVWRENVSRVISLYDKWSRMEADDAVVVIYASMYGNTAHVADHIAGVIARNGVRNVRVYDVSKTHISYLISELWRCKAVVLGSCAYNGEMFPLMESLCREVEHYGLKNRILAVFGSCSWGGGGVRNLKAFAERIGWELVAEPVEITGCPDTRKYESFNALAEAVAGKLNPKQ